MVGAGNIWRMPYVTGDNGGGAFLLAYFILLYLIAVPGLMAETALGRYSQQGLIGTFRMIFGKSRLVGLGLTVPIIIIVLMSYYAPVVGWSLYYTIEAVLGSLTGSNVDPGAIWSDFSGNPWLQIGMHTLTMTIVAGILLLGIRGGIERMTKWMMPFLLVSLIAIAIRGVTLPGAMAGLEFSFNPDWDYLTRGSTWLAALGQALFSTGLGWGIALTMGSYLGRNDDIPLGSGIFTAVGNTSFGLLAIFAVFPLVFAFGISPSSGSQLAFVALTSAFTKMLGGYFWAVLFFVSFFFANLTSAIGISEVGITTYGEESGVTRTKAVLTICAVIWLLGIPSAADSSVLGYLDFLIGNWGLPLATLMIILAAGWVFGARRLRLLSVNRGANMHVPRFWEWVVRFEIPVVVCLIFIAFFADSFSSAPLKTVISIGALAGLVGICLLLTSSTGETPLSRLRDCRKNKELS
ncbi:sodium-dependent transporter [Salinisphaera orenii]|uniref:sodium-dependent transporter n=1 Tax=Salinisphaera orenii TaxID=856731 RepID=UPI003A4C8344